MVPVVSTARLLFHLIGLFGPISMPGLSAHTSCSNMGKKSKIDSGDYEEPESIDPPPPYIVPEEPSVSNTYENPYPQVPEELVEPSAPPVPETETTEYTEQIDELPTNTTVIRIRDGDFQVYSNVYYRENTPLLNNGHSARYRYRGFPSAAIIFLLGW
jgi:hypothetical protein